ncbi:MAG TPA: hypothetical protein VMZ91_00280 [Candidatus Paceibacterota bacterium]|nr:hypothetical protein [Candidatus Paceibacterota bacterium]
MKKKNKKKRNLVFKKFEETFCDFLSFFLKDCFGDDFKFQKEPTNQHEGEQYGRDVSTEWEYDNEFFNWWFECKSHIKSSRHIKKIEVADKILYTIISPNPPFCWCLVSRNIEPDNWLTEYLPACNNCNNILKSPTFFYWTPKNLHIKSCISFYPRLWKKIYPREKILEIKPEVKNKLLVSIKKTFIEYNKKGSKVNEPKKEKIKRGVKPEIKYPLRDKIQEFKNTEEQIKYIPVFKKYGKKTK